MLISFHKIKKVMTAWMAKNKSVYHPNTVMTINMGWEVPVRCVAWQEHLNTTATGEALRVKIEECISSECGFNDAFEEMESKFDEVEGYLEDLE